MAKYDVTRSCGHVETVNLIGKTRDRQWRLENVEAQKLCRECYQAELAKQNAKAAAAAAEMGLPELTGTEKQVVWAETIRQDAIEYLDKMASEQGESPIAREVMDYILASRTRASWWIDQRAMTNSIIALNYVLEHTHDEMQQAKAEAKPEAAEAKAEATVRPESPVTETVAEIRPTDVAIEISFPERREDFREIVKKKLHMAWDYDTQCWRRRISYRTGTDIERAAEAGHRLLAAGFPIRIYDPETRQKAIDSEYEPECRRWVAAVTKGEYNGWFAISWDRDDDFYTAARKIRGSRWENPFIVVPPEQFEAILDFAEQYSFRLSPGAERVLVEAQRVKEEALIADVTAPADPEAIVTGRRPLKLDVPEVVEIDEALRDDD